MRPLVYFLAALGAYIVVLIVSQSLMRGVASEGWRIVLALSPMLPAIFMCWSILYTIRRLDELQRRVQLEALSVAFAATALITFSYGFLEGVGFPKLSMFAVWPLMAALWFVGVMVGRLRFR